MGQVFTWEAISSGKVPERESFQTVTQLLKTALADEASIVGALLFGSVIRGDFNIRSDIDCIVAYDDTQERVAMEVVQRLGAEANALHVPVNFTPCDTAIIRTRLHHLGPAFVAHLQKSVDGGGLIKGNFLDELAPTISVGKEVESYIKMKMYNMQESFAAIETFDEARLTLFLKKVLEAPIHVARRMLVYEGNLHDDSKLAVRLRYRKTMPADLADLLIELVDFDALYSVQLKNQLKNPNQKEYKAVLEGLKEIVPTLLHFLRLNILRLETTARLHF